MRFRYRQRHIPICRPWDRIDNIFGNAGSLGINQTARDKPMSRTTPAARSFDIAPQR